MYRDYDEERDDELYHYGKTSMKWGHHIYAMAKKAARSASKNLKAGGKFLKENPEFAYGVAAPAAAYQLTKQVTEEYDYQTKNRKKTKHKK